MFNFITMFMTCLIIELNLLTNEHVKNRTQMLTRFTHALKCVFNPCSNPRFPLS